VVPRFEDVCRRADVYVCDNSSTLFEFAATGRPVVLLNSAAWPKGRGPGLRFWEAAGVGVQVDRPADLGDAVQRAIELWGPDVRARQAALDIVYAFRSGAAERAVAAISEHVAVAA
jgi:CDP-glycerol glycerophosphotransferase (TagB/SpsB family)